MKNKFLSLALITTVLALTLISGAVFAQTDSGTDAQIDVEGDVTLSITLAGKMEAVTITGITAAVANASAAVGLSYNNDYVQVTDYTGASDAGHTFRVQFDINT